MPLYLLYGFFIAPFCVVLQVTLLDMYADDYTYEKYTSPAYAVTPHIVIAIILALLGGI